MKTANVKTVQSLVVICRDCGQSRWFQDICGCKIGHAGMYVRRRKSGEYVALRMHTYKHAAESLMHRAYA